MYLPLEKSNLFMEHINTDPMGQNQKHLKKTQICIFMRVLTEPSHKGQTSENMFLVCFSVLSSRSAHRSRKNTKQKKHK